MARNIGYRILFWWVLLLHKFYYRKIKVEGLENIPRGRIIFSPNHQNAIMDALAVLCTVKKPIFFLARSDFFKNHLLASLLRFLKIYPAYRRVEGYHQLINNYTTLAMARRWLLQGDYICIFPEGGHEGSWRLRPLSKGLFRLALEAQSEISREPIFIVPVSIYYSSYFQWGSKLYIKYGNPINVLPFYRLWRMNKGQGINRLKIEVEQAMRKIMLHVDEPFHSFVFDIVPYVTNFYNCYEFNFIQKFVNHCNQMILNHSEVLWQAKNRFEKINKEIRQLGISAECIKKNFSIGQCLIRSLIRIIIAPIVILPLLYLSPLILLTAGINKFINDKQFHSSVRFIILSMLPLWHGLFFVLVWNIAKSLAIAFVLTFFFIILTGYIFRNTQFFRNWFCEWKQCCHKKRIHRLKKEMEDIIQLLNFSYPYVAENTPRENIVSRH